MILYSLAVRQSAASLPVFSRIDLHSLICLRVAVWAGHGRGGGGGGLGGRQDDTAHVRLLLVIASFLFRKPRHGRTGGRTGGESTRGRMECEGKKWI